MEVAVDVIERQARGAEFLKLGVDFGAKLLAQAAVEEVAEANASRVVAELSGGSNEAGNSLEWQSGVAAEKGQMETDTEPWTFSGQRHRIIKGRFVDHKAGSGEDAFAVGADDGLIDRRRAAEVVGVNNEAAEDHGRGCFARGNRRNRGLEI